jgi:hypothetical protein
MSTFVVKDGEHKPFEREGYLFITVCADNYPELMDFETATIAFDFTKDPACPPAFVDSGIEAYTPGFPLEKGKVGRIFKITSRA